MPIVMGMVAGVSCVRPRSLRALSADVAIAAPMVVVARAAASLRWGRVIPPIIGALVVGAAAAIALGRFDFAALGALQLARPVIQTPAWSWAAMIELVVPLAITVLVVRTARASRCCARPAMRPRWTPQRSPAASARFSSAAVGAVCTCLAGPTNAILTSSGAREKQYVAGMATGLLSIAFGMVAPAFTRLMLQAPKAFIMTLAGLAMLRVLQGAFVATFKDRFSLGGLVAFLVTVADVGVANIGAAFWGLIAGVVASWLLERQDFRRLRRLEWGRVEQ